MLLKGMAERGLRDKAALLQRLANRLLWEKHQLVGGHLQSNPADVIIDVFAGHRFKATVEVEARPVGCFCKLGGDQRLIDIAVNTIESIVNPSLLLAFLHPGIPKKHKWTKHKAI